MRTVEPSPWSLGLRLQDEPEGTHRYTVAAGSAADGCAIEDLDALADDFWVSLVIRGGNLIAVRRDTTLLAGDEVLVLGVPESSDDHERVSRAFHQQG